MALKVMRKIDRRNQFYGRYKYQVKLGRLNANVWDVTQWCEEKFGPRLFWRENGGGDYSYHNSRNPRWTTYKKSAGRRPDLYIASDADAMMFSLVWAS